MKLNLRQTQLLSALKANGCTSPVSRQDIVDACTTSGAYACPPSWLTQDSARKVGRGLYDCPELSEIDGSVVASVPKTVSPAPAPVVKENVDIQTGPVQGAVEAVDNTALLAMGMTGGERQTLVPPRFDGYVAWGHFSDVEKIVRSRRNYNVFVTGLSGNGKTLMVEQVCAKLKRECYRVNITRQTDEDDLLGGFRLINGNTVWMDGPVVSAMKSGGVLLLDEIDLGSANLMCLQPVLEGKGVFLKKIGQWVTPADGFTVFATANTKGKGSDDGRFVGTGIMNEAMLDRFPITLEQPYATKATEKKILVKAGCDDVDFADHLTKWAEIIRKSFYEGAVDEIISTRRLVDIVNANAIFGDKSKAIAMCLARFDDDTKEAFLNLYSKVDADMQVGTDEGEASDVPASAEGNACPF
jgi:MoxR-like ATPase